MVCGCNDYTRLPELGFVDYAGRTKVAAAFRNVLHEHGNTNEAKAMQKTTIPLS
jgi:hypothetical protein